MKLPLFIFSDDLDIFRSAKEAERYFEPWHLEEPLEIFDAEGRLLTASVQLTRGIKILWLIPIKNETVSISETANFDQDRFKSKLISYLSLFDSNSSDKINFSNASLEELVECAIRKSGYTS